jgi:hypothetical protein
LFINSRGDGVHIQPHNDIPRRVVVANNLVMAAGDGIRVLSKPGQPSQVWVDGNVVAAGNPLAGGFRTQNHAYTFSHQTDALVEWEDSKPGRDWTKQRLLPLDEQASKALDELTGNLVRPGRKLPPMDETSWWRAMIQKVLAISQGTAGDREPHD